MDIYRARDRRILSNFSVLPILECDLISENIAMAPFQQSRVNGLKEQRHMLEEL